MKTVPAPRPTVEEIKALLQQAGELLFVRLLSTDRTLKRITYGAWTWDITVKRTCTDARQNTDAHALFALSEPLRAALGVNSTSQQRAAQYKALQKHFPEVRQAQRTQRQQSTVTKKEA
jgi:hypothetical protein